MTSSSYFDGTSLEELSDQFPCGASVRGESALVFQEFARSPLQEHASRAWENAGPRHGVSRSPSRLVSVRLAAQRFTW